MGRVRGPRILAAAAVAALVCVPPAAAVQRPLSLALRSAVASSRAAVSGAAVVDLRTGRRVFGHGIWVPLVPASNEKLVVTYAALLGLGPRYRFRTAVLGEGELDSAVWRGNLVLKGYGCPTLR